MIHSGRRGTASRRMALSSNLSSVCVIEVVSAAAARLWLHGEAIADAADGVKVRGSFRVSLEAFAQAHDEVVDRTRRRKHLVSPDASEDLLARHDVARPVGEHAQD